MQNEYKWMTAGILFLSICILISSFWLGEAIRNGQVQNKSDEALTIMSARSGLLSLSETSQYLNITEDQLKAIMSIEKKHKNIINNRLEYIMIDHEYFFSKEELNTWISEAMHEYREYRSMGETLDYLE